MVILEIKNSTEKRVKICLERDGDGVDVVIENDGLEQYLMKINSDGSYTRYLLDVDVAEELGIRTKNKKIIEDEL